MNRYPMLFIDLVDYIDPLKKASGYKNFSINEWFFAGHFQNDPVVPGSILSEAMNQMFLMAVLSKQELIGKKAASSKISDVFFYHPVIPGDRLCLEAEVTHYNRGIAKGNIIGRVNDRLTCSQRVIIVIPDVVKEYGVKNG
jgi:3-hydroxyacyl-[acyl-carrier-protein] dehydratase